jgi:hypothetical protein
MTPTFIPLWFNIQNSFYYLRGRLGNIDKAERPKVMFTQKDVDLYNWLVENVGPAEGPMENLPIKGEGWEMVGSQSTMYPFDDYVRKAGVYIDDDMLAVQLKCSGVLDDRPVDPIIKMIKEMEAAMLNVQSSPQPPFFTIDSLSQLAPVSGKSKYRAEDFNVFFPKSK